jgi:hypothetical protein
LDSERRKYTYIGFFQSEIRLTSASSLPWAISAILACSLSTGDERIMDNFPISHDLTGRKKTGDDERLDIHIKNEAW